MQDAVSRMLMQMEAAAVGAGQGCTEELQNVAVGCRVRM